MYAAEGAEDIEMVEYLNQNGCNAFPLQLYGENPALRLRQLLLKNNRGELYPSIIYRVIFVHNRRRANLPQTTHQVFKDHKAIFKLIQINSIVINPKYVPITIFYAAKFRTPHQICVATVHLRHNESRVCGITLHYNS